MVALSGQDRGRDSPKLFCPIQPPAGHARDSWAVSTVGLSRDDLVLMRAEEASAVSAEEDLYERYGDGLVRFATAIVGPSDAQDVVSDAMTRLFASGALRSAQNPRALMYRATFAAAKSLQRSAIRRRRRERTTAQRLVLHDPEIRPDVARAVLALSPQQRACVWLTYWADLSIGDVAEYLGVEQGTVKQHLFRARNRLKEALDE